MSGERFCVCGHTDAAHRAGPAGGECVVEVDVAGVLCDCLEFEVGEP